MDLQPLPAFDDNYVWCLRDSGGRALIVGEVAALADKLHWFGEPPRHWQVLRRAA